MTFWRRRGVCDLHSRTASLLRALSHITTWHFRGPAQVGMTNPASSQPVLGLRHSHPPTVLLLLCGPSPIQLGVLLSSRGGAPCCHLPTGLSQPSCCPAIIVLLISSACFYLFEPCLFSLLKTIPIFKKAPACCIQPRTDCL